MATGKRSLAQKRSGKARTPPRERPAKEASPTSRREAGGTRDRLLEAGEEEFGAHGLRGARVQEIVARAGVNERMLYHYFGDKEGLYLAVCARCHDSLAAEFEAALDAPKSTDPVDRLAELLRVYFDAIAARPFILRVFLYEALAGWPSGEKMQEMRRDSDARVTPKLIALFADAERAGVFRQGVDPIMALLTAGSSFLVLLLSLSRMSQVFPGDLRDPAQLAALRDRLIDTLLHGVVAPHHRRS
jgi:AcrR family transcriptional regulator